MAKSDNFHRHKSDPPGYLFFELATSILLHCILFLGSNDWLRAFVPEQKLSQEIPIEYVEVPPDETKTPPKTSRRAAKDSVAGGKAKLERPVSAAKSASPVAPKASADSPKDLRANLPAQAFRPELTQPKAVLPNLYSHKPEPQPPQTAEAPRATTPRATKPPQTAEAPPDLAPPEPKPPQTAEAPPDLAPPEPKPAPTAEAPPDLAPPEPKPAPTALTPATAPRATKSPQTAIAPSTTQTNPQFPKTEPSETRLSGRTPSQVQPSLKTGAASRLGGSVSVSSSNFRGDDLASLPNSNRSNQAPEGIDARREDIDISSYLEQMQQRVKQHWIPGLSQSSRRTVLNFTINRSGRVSNIEIAQTSGLSVTDKAALKAIKQAAPFTPLPIGYTSNYIHIQFTFDINVYGELDLWRDGG